MDWAADLQLDTLKRLVGIVAPMAELMLHVPHDTMQRIVRFTDLLPEGLPLFAEFAEREHIGEKFIAFVQAKRPDLAQRVREIAQGEP